MLVPNFSPGEFAVSIRIQPNRIIEVAEGDVPLSLYTIALNREGKVAVAGLVCPSRKTQQQCGNEEHEALHHALDMAHLLNRPITQLSGGERQRVGLAAVAHRDAKVWLLDEPVSFQDPAHQQQLAQWLCAQTQAGVVLTAHDMNWVSQVATHVIALTAEGAVIGERDAVLSAEVLQRTFGCAWQQVQGRWLTG